MAQQIQKVVVALGDFLEVEVHACVGGTAVRDDIRKLQAGVHIVVGTPGRVYDMINRRALRLDSIRQFFVDEIEKQGTNSGTPRRKVTIVDSGVM